MHAINWHPMIRERHSRDATPIDDERRHRVGLLTSSSSSLTQVVAIVVVVVVVVVVNTTERKRYFINFVFPMDEILFAPKKRDNNNLIAPTSRWLL